jgi:L-fucono-1,5-lactonase
VTGGPAGGRPAAGGPVSGVIDAHHHLWDPATRRHAWLDELPTLRRAFGPTEFGALAARHGVTGSVLVQVLADTAETEEFLALAAAGPLIAGVVGWADLADPGIAGELARLRARPGGDRLAGIRHLVQSEPDPDWLRRPAVRRGLRAVGAAGLAYDLLVRPAQLPAAVAVVSALPEVRFVVDHGGKPDIAAGQWEPWATLTAELAGRPNVWCKLSGLVTEAGDGWQPGQIARYAGWLLDRFGPGRLMFGSDWPVCTLAADYGQVQDLALAAVAGLTPAERDAVLAGNAVRCYELAPPAATAPAGGPAGGPAGEPPAGSPAGDSPAGGPATAPPGTGGPAVGGK